MDTDKILDFLMEIGKLKTTKRSGWVLEGVKNPESVADHTFRSTIAVLVLGNGRKDINLEKALKMALIHDIAESQIGDVLVDWKIKAHGKEKIQRLAEAGIHGVTEEEKLKREKEGMEKLVSLLGGFGKEILDLWKEFEDGKTNEAVFVESVEKFEMMLQAWEYEKSQTGIDISAWFDHKKNHEKIKDTEIKKLLDKVVEKRKIKSSEVD